MRPRRRFALLRVPSMACAVLALALLTGCDGRSDARTGDERAVRDFLRGNAAFARSEAAEAESNRPDGDATARERAMADAEDALGAWRMAAASRSDWPEARRNVERVLLRLERLRQKKQGPGKPGTGPSAKPEGPTPNPDLPVGVVTAELPAAEVMGLIEVLLERERQKRALRRTRPSQPAGSAERDW